MCASANTQIHTEYSFQNPPAHPGQEWTRFVCISDTHSCTNFEIPPGDVLLYGGDISSWGTYKQTRKTIDWLCTLPHPTKVVIAGNHDHALDPDWAIDTPDSLRADVESLREYMSSDYIRDSGIIYLNREQCDITTSQNNRWKVYGSPASPSYVHGAFQYAAEAEAIEEWSRIPDNVDILLTHTPPYGILDKTRRGKHAGCPHLTERLQSLRAIRLHIFGHIHEACGVTVIETDATDGTQNVEDKQVRVYVNAALPHASHPVIVDLKSSQ